MDGLIQRQIVLAQKFYEFWISRVDITTLQYACQQIRHRIVLSSIPGIAECKLQGGELVI